MARVLLSGALGACKERLDASKDNVARLIVQKDHLLQQLTEHGDSIEVIKAKLTAQPKIHVSSEPPSPDPAKEGDIWL